MPWQTISAIQVTNTWQFTAPINGNLFRLKHSLLGTAHGFMSGLVCQAAFTNEQIEIYQPQKIYPRNELVILEFISPACFFDRRIGIKKRQSREINNLVWIVEVSIWNNEI
ncbi:hypothetical protein [Nostoc punctiforme]|uniref:hypothetical protein n=1 Tax=Nostoc punctiforme TaxID=272131 RepID=UPI000045C128|nr:hypothetical protein [Nostoc punctiforme]